MSKAGTYAIIVRACLPAGANNHISFQLTVLDPCFSANLHINPIDNVNIDINQQPYMWTVAPVLTSTLSSTLCGAFQSAVSDAADAPLNPVMFQVSGLTITVHGVISASQYTIKVSGWQGTHNTYTASTNFIVIMTNNCPDDGISSQCPPD